ncbi:hypothetical protein [Lyngbya sp. CCY1209]|uniref:hypothetical protein n=1 Tax=Lyngbya sp. CCY1209 TaxID=2886103 RepID=UPI002D215B3A|nr:hypothetical protein [Lyngbya sp. CCY1209]MEB3884909.1 hypothetical protein [Lyngbya sp. CCY1209]
MAGVNPRSEINFVRAIAGLRSLKTVPETLTQLSLRLGRLVRAIGAIVWVVGAGNLEVLKSIEPGLVTMKADRASGFILAGSSPILWHRQAEPERSGQWKCGWGSGRPNWRKVAGTCPPRSTPGPESSSPEIWGRGVRSPM